MKPPAEIQIAIRALGSVRGALVAVTAVCSLRCWVPLHQDPGRRPQAAERRPRSPARAEGNRRALGPRGAARARRTHAAALPRHRLWRRPARIAAGARGVRATIWAARCWTRPARPVQGVRGESRTGGEIQKGQRGGQAGAATACRARTPRSPPWCAAHGRPFPSASGWWPWKASLRNCRPAPRYYFVPNEAQRKELEVDRSGSTRCDGPAAGGAARRPFPPRHPVQQLLDAKLVEQRAVHARVLPHRRAAHRQPDQRLQSRARTNPVDKERYRIYLIAYAGALLILLGYSHAAGASYRLLNAANLALKAANVGLEQRVQNARASCPMRCTS